MLDYPRLAESQSVQGVCYIISDNYYGLKILLTADQKAGDSLAISKVFTSMPLSSPKYVDFDETQMVLVSWSYKTYYVYVMTYQNLVRSTSDLKN